MKLLIMGLPGSGKTTLATKLAFELKSVLFDADSVRPRLWPELGYSLEDRVENSRRLGALCDLVNLSGQSTIASFVCPLPETRNAFKAQHTIWIDRIKSGRFEDTNKMFVPPAIYDLRLTRGSVDEWLGIILNQEWIHGYARRS